MRIKIFMIFSDIKISWFKPADCGNAHCHCNPRAWPEKCCTVNFYIKTHSLTNIITLFMTTVKHFIKISTQQLEIIQRKTVKRINCCLLLCHFVSDFGFPGLMTLHFKPRFWLAELTEPMWLNFNRLATHRAFFSNRMCGGLDFMTGCVN